MTFTWKFSAGFFVRKITKKGEAKEKPAKRLDAHVIMQAKHIGLTMEELNETTAQDFLDLMDAYFEINDPQKPEKRKANQADIDRFTGWKPK